MRTMLAHATGTSARSVGDFGRYVSGITDGTLGLLLCGPMSTGAATVPDDGAALPRIVALDGVRGVAILLTLIFHSFDSSQSLAPVGERGVDLFFVLSGFLITGILIDTRSQAGYYRNFYVRRAVRILPLYYLFVVLMLFVAPRIAEALPDNLGGVKDLRALGDGPPGVWTVWVYLQNFVLAQGPRSLPGLGHLWSLAIEEQFYLFWPIVIWFVPERWRFRMLFWGIVGTMLLRTGLLWGGVIDDWAARELTFTRLDSLMLGGLGALWIRDADVRTRLEPGRRFLARKGWIVLLIPALFVDAKPTWAPAAWSGSTGASGTTQTIFQDILYGPGLTMVSIAFLGYILGAVRNTLGPRTTRFTNHRFNLMLGKYSYAIYLFHFPIAAALKYRDAGKLSLGGTPLPLVDSLINMAIVTAVSLAIARVSWIFWEEPWLRLKRRFAYAPVASPHRIQT